MIQKYIIRKVKLSAARMLLWFVSFKHDLRKIFFEYSNNIPEYIFFFCGLISAITLTIEFGFYYPTTWAPKIQNINQILIYYFLVYQITSFVFTIEPYRNYIKSHKPELLITSLIILQKLNEKSIIEFFKLQHLGAEEATLIFLAINQVFFSFSGLVTLFRETRIYNFKKLNPSLMFTLSFTAIIIIGTFLLSLPKAQIQPIPLVDILFTVISATCVTGLSTIDISQSLTFTGQLILMSLIQIGGLGLITLTTFFSIFLAGKVSVNDGLLMKDLFSEDALGEVKDLIKNIALQTFLIELIGAIMLYFLFPLEGMYNISDKIFISIFHSVSAFCNAGFSLFPKGLGEEFIYNEKGFLTIIMFLILTGGIGFSVLGQITRKLFTREGGKERFTISSKLAMLMSVILILSGSIAYFYLEKNFTLKNRNMEDQIFHSLFYSVSTRTAGFNTLDVAIIGIPMTFFSLLLMWIGASPNSTGGGIKTTTFAVSILQIFDFVRGKQKLEIFKREIAPSTLFRAAATIVLSLFVIFSAIFSLIIIEKFPFIDVCYEVVSAFGTVGLSRGITSSLHTYSKLIICVVMFAGRVGILTILIAITPKKESLNYAYPTEYVIVG